MRAALLFRSRRADAGGCNAQIHRPLPAFASDGSVAAYVPTRRALAWQSVAPDGTAIVRERYWITLQPGEVRACDGCHGVNQASQSNAPAATNTALAFRQLLATWRDTAPLFADDFEQ